MRFGLTAFDQLCLGEQNYAPFKVDAMPNFYPDNVIDEGISAIPAPVCIRFASLWGMDEEGELPDDLSPAETVLTNVLWGETDIYRAALLVAGLENMALELVKAEMKNNGFTEDTENLF